MPGTAHYELAPLADGVWAGLARPTGAAVSNAGLIDLGPQTLVFDTGMAPRAGAAMRQAAVDRTGRPPGLVANSHHHLDHLLGNQAFPERTAIYATRRTIEVLAERQEEIGRILRPEALDREIAELAMRVREATDSRTRSRWSLELGFDRIVRPEAAEIRLTIPTVGFEDRLALPGDLGAELRTFGSGHTAGDAVLFLPGSRTLFAGDLVLNRVHPSLGDGDPEHWIEVLRRLEALRPERIVPGHGPVAGPEAIDAMVAYLEAILPLAGTTGRPAIPAACEGWKWPGQFDANVEFLRGRAAARSRQRTGA
ncbi:MAG: MBL fold metallo-hydrolase [Thermoplasmata archaeon]